MAIKKQNLYLDKQSFDPTQHLIINYRYKSELDAKEINLNNFKEVEHIHFFGYYIGNYPSLTNDKIRKICKILNSISYV